MQRNKIVQRMKSLPPVAYMLVVLISVIFSVMSPNYLTLMNFKNVLIQATPLMIVAFGQNMYRPDAGNRPVLLVRRSAL